MTEARARVFEYHVDTDREWTARSDLGGPALMREAEWTPEHLLLAGLSQCALTSLEFHAKRAGVQTTAAVSTHGTVTRRAEDGRFAFVEISVALDLTVEPQPELDALRELLQNAEHDCFVGASLTAKPTYTWTIDGEEL
jgi:organic hydroperoxide reductase OsmC/OhrA